MAVGAWLFLGDSRAVILELDICQRDNDPVLHAILQPVGSWPYYPLGLVSSRGAVVALYPPYYAGHHDFCLQYSIF